MIKHILCAIDISEEADRIIESAISLAKMHDASLSLMTVVENTFLPVEYQLHLEEAVVPSFHEICDKYSVDKKNRHIGYGQSYGEICEVAKKEEVDLIFLGSHGKGGLESFLLGSTASGVVHRAPCSVYLLKV